ncbi:hypothetical protein HC031_16380 [Planosporangium thailandense]|uniref:O-antigen ligase domain-containing protein n=1 Tax=Planosporangium thailandense TaxID=765197 RepID=A0ABX0XZ02_9ACTN|nr:hypothetical protein [Planosporangium thailandense]NJC71278.1 hypothetical protein [Planosporangium thailandense]
MSTEVTVVPLSGDTTTWRRRGGVVLLGVVAGALVPVGVALPPYVLMLMPVAVGVIAIGYLRPHWAAYLLFAVTPLTAGLTRGSSIPLLRPYEAVEILLGAGVAARALAQRRAGYRLPLRLTRIDAVILAMAVTSSLLPLLWLAARGLSPTLEDLLYASKIWKFYGLFLLVRACVRTDRQVVRCLQVSLAAYAVVAVVAMLQAMNIAGVPQLVNTIYGAEGNVFPREGRGTSTLGSSIAVGDVMAFHLAICAAWLLHGRGRRPLLAALAVLFTFGGLASGQFSGVIALGAVMLAIAILTGHVRRLLLASVPVVLIGAAVLWPVAQARIADFDISTGLPQSWMVRYDNLRLFVWPQVFSGFNWLFGVRPSEHIAVDADWGPYIYIESGHTWLLWTGGIPFLLAFLLFTWVTARTTAAVARRHPGPRRVAASAAFASLFAVFVLMSFDPHITLRGAADLLFSLIALSIGGQGRGAVANPDLGGTAEVGHPPAATEPTAIT